MAFTQFWKWDWYQPRWVRRALFALLRTSKLFHHFALPHLYHRISTFDENNGAGFVCFVRTIRANPQLACHTKSIVEPVVGAYNWTRDFSEDEMRSFLNTFLQHATNIQFMDVDMWVYVHHSRAYTYVSTAGIALRTMAENHLNFKDLAWLTLSGNRPGLRSGFQHLICAASNLKTITFDDEYGLEDIPRALINQPLVAQNMANITNIYLRIHSLDPGGHTQGVLNLIDGCRQLESFFFHLKASAFSVSHFDDIVSNDPEYKQLGDQVHLILLRLCERHGPTLRSLELYFPEMRDRGPDSAPDNLPMFYVSGFTNCPNLKDLSLDIGIFQRARSDLATWPWALADLLPSSLATLTLENFSDNPGIMGRQLLGLEDAVRGAPCRFPHLHTVNIQSVTSSVYMPASVPTANFVYNPVGDLSDGSGLDENGQLKDEDFIRLETVACLWARRSPGFSVVWAME
ncbi:hypothetical protein B0T16DRAFT_516799 [Cercophora newfieldiana]|uniref:Uncharacterized protein n=1 Tax=Cercophora newfieldiana TaxID=92897 RepID=A0AA39XXL6_9PEZI|nr:hypothetical protein B0T16DRAFT_516799 [Cercophora newfieldiana]